MKFFTLLLFVFISAASFSQKKVPSADFIKADQQQFGFDSPDYFRGKKAFQSVRLADSVLHAVPVKSVGYLQSDVVLVRISNLYNLAEIQLINVNNDKPLRFQRLNDSTLRVTLDPEKEPYKVQLLYKANILAQLDVKVYRPITHQIVMIGIDGASPYVKDLKKYLDSIYKPSNIQFNIIGHYKLDVPEREKDQLLANPSFNHDLYTAEMRVIRDAFLEKHPKTERKAFYLFITPGFVNKRTTGYMARNKAMAFIKQNQSDIRHTIAHQLGFGIGMLEETYPIFSGELQLESNLMDSSDGCFLNHRQWDELRHESQSYSLYDGDEDVKTNNGMVAYYFWEEDSLGNIIIKQNNILSTIKRPYKKNYLSYHLNIQDVLFRIIWQYKSQRICWWHVITAGILLLLLRVGRIYRNRVPKERLQNIRFLKWSTRLTILILAVGSYFFIGHLLTNYEVKSGLIADFKGFSYQKANTKILHNIDLKYENQTVLSSEIMIKRGNNWYMKRREKVLYFSVYQDSASNTTQLKFASSSDSLLLFNENYRELAQSHYLVYNFYNDKDSLIRQKAYNHLGVEISDKLELKDPAKRILLFVNGYRPTSIGRNFEENFDDVFKNGLEYPNSSNQIYDFDRYDYWKPWNEIDERFKKRINPTETYYADGHHSVSTSNHRSLIKFSQLSSIYPNRCSNKNKHTCVKTPNDSPTLNLLPTRPNKRGFNERFMAGKIAARNLKTMLNEIPNDSSNDTLYIIAHSMGYAYALGMIEELRGTINFGSFYIIAPENASAKEVFKNEWKQVWQYGSKWNEKIREYPCLQDGIAPQVCAQGLSENERVYIPLNLYRRKGFFDSHFIGYYDWILKIDKGKKGHIQQL